MLTAGKTPIADFFCLGKKFLVYNLVSRNLKIKYHRSVFGLFWTLLAPLAMAAVYYFVFQKIVKVQIPHYLAFVLSGVLPWAFFSSTLIEGLESVVGNVGLATKIPIPVQVFPFTGAVTNLITLSFALPILVGAAIVSGVSIGSSFLLIPIYFVALFLLAYSFALVLSLAFVFLRDLRHVITIVMQIWFFATPVLYEERMLPPGFGWAVHLNPVGDIFCGLHGVIARGAWPEPRRLLITAAWTLMAVVGAMWFQRKYSQDVVEHI